MSDVALCALLDDIDAMEIEISLADEEEATSMAG
jgi:hypothetical protein